VARDKNGTVLDIAKTGLEGHSFVDNPYMNPGVAATFELSNNDERGVPTNIGVAAAFIDYETFGWDGKIKGGRRDGKLFAVRNGKEVPYSFTALLTAEFSASSAPLQTGAQTCDVIKGRNYPSTPKDDDPALGKEILAYLTRPMSQKSPSFYASFGEELWVKNLCGVIVTTYKNSPPVIEIVTNIMASENEKLKPFLLDASFICAEVMGPFVQKKIDAKSPDFRSGTTYVRVYGEGPSDPEELCQQEHSIQPSPETTAPPAAQPANPRAARFTLPAQPSKPPASAPKTFSLLRIRLAKAKYNSFARWVEVEGTAKNIGTKDVFSPTIFGKVFDKNGALLGENHTGVVGQSLFSSMTPGEAGGFSMVIPVRGGTVVTVDIDPVGEDFEIFWTDQKLAGGRRNGRPFEVENGKEVYVSAK
jgi:hypothetical protein